MASTESLTAGQAHTAAADLQIPVVFGVTGHRDLDAKDVPRLEESVYQFLKHFHDHHRKTPLILLSPLAEGADRLVARVALRESIGARLMAPLPMRQEFYEQDFKNQDSINEFREFLRHAPHFRVPKSPGDHDVSQTGTARDAQYRAVGEFIVRYSQNVIALWDGEPSGGEGGTAEIVELQRTGLMQREAPKIEPPEGFPVYWIPASHAHSKKQLAITKPEWLYPALFKENKKRARAYYDRIFKRVNEFNQHVARDSQAFRKKVQQSKSYVLEDEEIESLSKQERLTLERYAVADALAMTFQKWTKLLILALHISIFLSFVLFVLFAHLPKQVIEESDRWPLLVFSGGALVVAAGLLFLNWWLRIYINRQDYRAMAEGLRVALFWKLAGIPDSVADHYLWSQRSELDWIRFGIRGWMLPPAVHIRHEHEDYQLRLVLKRWVENQQKYFEDQEKRSERIAVWNEWIATAFLLAAAVAGIALFLTARFQPESRTTWDIELIVVEVTLAAGALLHNYNERMAFARHAKQYARMQPVFKYAADKIRQAIERGEAARARELLHELGEQALTENGDWVVIHRERPVEVPHP